MKILLSGPIGIGKSTVIARAIALLDDLRVAGLRTRPLLEEGTRLGYVLESLSGEQRVFAHVDWPGTIRLGRFGVRPEVFAELGVRALEEGLAAELAVIDELGLAEIDVAPYVRAVQALIAAPGHLLAVVQARAWPFWEARLCAPASSRRLEVSRTNRDELPHHIAGLLRLPPRRAR
ncbi:MAG: hypothetical protein JXQ29_09455 [Planctomycetes bacterium]|nr:hypothetical protein [Planctomycetota bacterium]